MAWLLSSAVLWLGACAYVLVILYGHASDADNCERRPAARVVAVEGSWPWQRHFCVYERRDGTQFKVSDDTKRIVTLGVFGLFGVGGSVALVVVAVRRERQ